MDTNSNVKHQLYVHSWLFFSPFLIWYRISFRIDLELFRLLLFFLCHFRHLCRAWIGHVKKSFDLLVANATDLRSILFSSRHYGGAHTNTHTHTHHVCMHNICVFHFYFGIICKHKSKWNKKTELFGITQSLTIMDAKAYHLMLVLKTVYRKLDDDLLSKMFWAS